MPTRIISMVTQLQTRNTSLLKQESAGRHVSQLGHIIMIPSKSVFDFLNAECLAEKQQTPIL
jgi:hypothetical protein